MLHQVLVSPSVFRLGLAGGDEVDVLPEGSDRGHRAPAVGLHPEGPELTGLLNPLDPHPAPGPALDDNHGDWEAGLVRLLQEDRDVEPAGGVEWGLRYQHVEDLVPGHLLVAGPGAGQGHGPNQLGGDDGGGTLASAGAQLDTVEHLAHDLGLLPACLLGYGRPPVRGQGELGQAGAGLGGRGLTLGLHRLVVEDGAHHQAEPGEGLGPLAGVEDNPQHRLVLPDLPGHQVGAEVGQTVTAEVAGGHHVYTQPSRLAVFTWHCTAC